MFNERHSDVGNARWFVRLVGEQIRYLPERDKWIVFNGSAWQEDADGQIERFAKQAVNAMLEHLEQVPRDDREALFKHVLRSEQAPRIAATINLARSELGVTVHQRDLDADPMILGVQGGVVDLKTGTYRTPSPLAYITRQAACEFNPHATCPLWLEVLNHAMDGDGAMVGFLQRAFGYCLTGDTREQNIFLPHGPGANSKTVILQTFAGMMGGYAANTSADTFLDRRESTASNDLARLAGVRFVVAGEIDEGKRMAESLVKVVTGGEPLVVRFLFQEYFEYVPAFKLWIALNHKPTIRGDDYGIWRRIRLIPFRVTIPPEEQDRELGAKLKREWPGILQWAITGCLEWQRIGLAPPAPVIAATESYREESDAIGEWLTENTIQAPNISEQAATLYADYRSFIETRGSSPLSMRRWAQRMGDRGFEKVEARVVRYQRIGLRDLRDLGDQFPEPSANTSVREEVSEKGRKGRNGRNESAYARESKGY